MIGAGVVAVGVAVGIIVLAALNTNTGSGGGASTTAATEFASHTHIIGEPDAPVTVVEFGDFQ